MALCSRLPAEPLKRALVRTMTFRGLCWEELGVRLGLSSRTLLRVMSATNISPYVADHVAIRLGTHPVLLWPREWGQTASSRKTCSSNRR